MLGGILQFSCAFSAAASGTPSSRMIRGPWLTGFELFGGAPQPFCRNPGALPWRVPLALMARAGARLAAPGSIGAGSAFGSLGSADPIAVGSTTRAAQFLFGQAIDQGADGVGRAPHCDLRG